MMGIGRVIGRNAASSKARNAIKRMFTQEGSPEGVAGSLTEGKAGTEGAEKNPWMATFKTIMFGEQSNSPKGIEIAVEALASPATKAESAAKSTAESAAKSALKSTPSDVAAKMIVKPIRQTSATSKLPNSVKSEFSQQKTCVPQTKESRNSASALPPLEPREAIPSITETISTIPTKATTSSVVSVETKPSKFPYVSPSPGLTTTKQTVLQTATAETTKTATGKTMTTATNKTISTLPTSSSSGRGVLRMENRVEGGKSITERESIDGDRGCKTAVLSTSGEGSDVVSGAMGSGLKGGVGENTSRINKDAADIGGGGGSGSGGSGGGFLRAEKKIGVSPKKRSSEIDSGNSASKPKQQSKNLQSPPQQQQQQLRHVRGRSDFSAAHRRLFVHSVSAAQSSLRMQQQQPRQRRMLSMQNGRGITATSEKNSTGKASNRNQSSVGFKEKSPKKVLKEPSISRALIERQRKLQLKAQEQKSLLRYRNDPFLADITSQPRDFHSPSTRVSRIVAASAVKCQLHQGQTYHLKEPLLFPAQNLEEQMRQCEISTEENCIISPDLIEGISFPSSSPSPSSKSDFSIDSDYLLLLRERAIHGVAAERELTRIFQEITKEMDNFLKSIDTAKSEMSVEEARRAVGIVEEGEAKRSQEWAYGSVACEDAVLEMRENKSEQPMLNSAAENCILAGAEIEGSKGPVLARVREEMITEHEEMEVVVNNDLFVSREVERESLIGQKDLSEGSGAMNQAAKDAQFSAEALDSTNEPDRSDGEKEESRQATPQFRHDSMKRSFSKDDCQESEETKNVVKKIRREWTPEELEAELRDKIVVKPPKKKPRLYVHSSPAVSSAPTSTEAEIGRGNLKTNATTVERMIGNLAEFPSNGSEMAEGSAFGSSHQSSVGVEIPSSCESPHSNIEKRRTGIDGVYGGRGEGGKFYEEDAVRLSNVNRNSEAKDAADDGGFLWLKLLKNLTNKDGSWRAGHANVNFNATSNGANGANADLEASNLWLVMAKNIAGIKSK